MGGIIMAAFYNQATLSFNGNTTTSNITQGELLDALKITKTAIADSYNRGDLITYVISITNTSAAAYSDLTLTDNLGGYAVGGTTVYPLEYVSGSVRRYVNGNLTAQPTVTQTAPLTITEISVPANGNAIIAYQARVTAYAQPTAGSTLTNTAALSGTGLAEALSAQAEISAAEQAVLTISKSVSPCVVSANGTLTYTFIIQNTGNTAATTTDSIIVTDTFDPRLSNITVTYNGTTWTERVNYTYNEQTGLFQTNEGQIAVSAATFTQNADTGEWTITPGTAAITVTGTV